MQRQECRDERDIDGWNWWRRVMMGGRWDDVSESRRERGRRQHRPGAYASGPRHVVPAGRQSVRQSSR